MRLGRRRLMLAAGGVAIAGVASWLLLMTTTSGSRGTVRVTFATPSGAAGVLTAWPAPGSAPNRWCARVVVHRSTGGGVDQEGCDEGVSARLRGTFIADCAARTLIAFGAQRPEVMLSQPRENGAPIRAVTAAASSLIRDPARFYAIAVDLREAPPELRAVDPGGGEVGRVRFVREAAGCRNGLAIFGGF